MKFQLDQNQSEIKREKYLQGWVIATLAVPVILDFLFLGSSIARYSRVLIFCIISASLLVNSKLFLRGKIVGLGTIIITIFLYLVGTISGLARGNSITPNIASLILILLIIALNFDLQQVALKSIGHCVNLLIVLSVLAIIFKLNPRDYYSTSAGYPVFFDFLGLPGRNYGIFSHPNSLGQAAALSILFIVASRRNLLLLVFPVFCILKCGSRTSIIAIVVCLLVYGIVRIFKLKNFSKVVRMETPVVIATLVMGIFLASSFQFLSYIQFLDPGSLTGRISIWQSSLEIYRSSSLFGLGWGWEERAIDSQLLSYWAVSSHNAILEIIFSSGIVGIALFLSLLSKVIVQYGNLLTIEKMIVLAILISGVSESYIDLQYPTIQTYLFFLIILGASEERRVHDDG